MSTGGRPGPEGCSNATQGRTERQRQSTQPTYTRRKSEGTGRCIVYQPVEPSLTRSVYILRQWNLSSRLQRLRLLPRKLHCTRTHLLRRNLNVVNVCFAEPSWQISLSNFFVFSCLVFWCFCFRASASSTSYAPKG
jgi:hypothetical protein